MIQSDWQVIDVQAVAADLLTTWQHVSKLATRDAEVQLHVAP